MQTNNPYELVHLLGLCQRQAGVDKEVANLVCAYARLQADQGHNIEFYSGIKSDAKAGNDLLVRELAARNPDAETRFIAFLRKYSRCLAARRLPVIFNTGHLAEKLRISEAFLKRLHRGACGDPIGPQHSLYRFNVLFVDILSAVRYHA